MHKQAKTNSKTHFGVSYFPASKGSFPGVFPSANTSKRASASREFHYLNSGINYEDTEMSVLIVSFCLFKLFYLDEYLNFL